MDADAAPGYTALFFELATLQMRRVSGGGVRVPPSLYDPWGSDHAFAAPIDSRAVGWIAHARELGRYTRCEWRTAYEYPTGGWLTVTRLPWLFAIEGQGRTQSRDFRGAALIYLDAIRLGLDLELTGVDFRCLDDCMQALGWLIASPASRELPLEQIAGELIRLEEELMAIMLDACRKERLRALERLLGGRWADFMALDAHHREVESFVARGYRPPEMPEAPSRLAARLEMLAWLRIARAAVALELGEWPRFSDPLAPGAALAIELGLPGYRIRTHQRGSLCLTRRVEI